MTTFSERQYLGRPLLLCNGREQHVASFPKILHSDGGISGDLTCALCGESLSLIHVIVKEPQATFSTLDAPFATDPHLYTDARLHPLRMLQESGRRPD